MVGGRRRWRSCWVEVWCRVEDYRVRRRLWCLGRGRGGTVGGMMLGRSLAGCGTGIDAVRWGWMIRGLTNNRLRWLA